MSSRAVQKEVPRRISKFSEEMLPHEDIIDVQRWKTWFWCILLSCISASLPSRPPHPRPSPFPPSSVNLCLLQWLLLQLRLFVLISYSPLLVFLILHLFFLLSSLFNSLHHSSPPPVLHSSPPPAPLFPHLCHPCPSLLCLLLYLFLLLLLFYCLLLLVFLCFHLP